MTKLQSAITALASAGITAIAFTIVTPTETINKVQLQTITSGILAKATPECIAMVRANCKQDDADCLNNPNPCQQVVVSDGANCTKEVTEEKPDKDGKIETVVKVKAACEKITGWSCNGAYMPQVGQECLSEAVDKAKPIGEVIEKP